MPADVAKGNAMFSFFDGLGKLICYALASTTLDKPKFVKDEPDFATDARLQFGIAALVAMVCVGITLATVTEPPAPSKPSTRSLRDSIVHAWSLAYQVAFLKETTQDKAYELVPTKYVHEDEVDDVLDDEDDESPVGKGETRKSPPPSYSMLRCVCMTEIGLWYGLSSWQVWGGILVGKSILGGTPAGTDLEVEKFQAGILLFSLGLAGANLVSLVVAPAYPWLLRTFGARKLFIAGGCVMSIATGILALLPALSAHHKTFLNDADTGSSFDLVFRDPTFLAAVLLFTLLGFPWSCHMNIPFSTVGRAYQDAPDVGLITATLNTSLCVAQLAMSLTTALLIRLSRGDPSICFAAASVAGIFSVYHACTLQVPYDESDSSSSRLPVVACGAH